MRVLATLALPIMLSGCALPVGLSIASYAADGLSFGASDKSVNDHMISQIIGMDCGLFRVFTGRSVCQERGTDPDDDTIYLADLEPIEGRARPWGTAAEPELAYATENEGVARDWAVGIELADAQVAGDPSNRTLFGSPAQADDAPKYVGEYAYNQDRDRRIDAVRGRLEAYYAAADGNSDPEAEVQAAAPALATESPPAPMIVNVEGFRFGQSMGMTPLYANADALALSAVGETAVPSASAEAGRIAEDDTPSFDDLLVPAAWRPVREQDLVGTEFGTDDLVLAPVEVANNSTTESRLADSTIRSGDARFLVVGSFVSRERAQLAAQAAGSAEFAIIEALVNGQTFYRVVTGPFQVAAVDDAKTELADIGFEKSWAIRTCPTGITSNACLPGVAVAGLLPNGQGQAVFLAAAAPE